MWIMIKSDKVNSDQTIYMDFINYSSKTNLVIFFAKKD